MYIMSNMQAKMSGAKGKQAMLAKKAFELIQRKGIIHRFELMDMLGITIQAMNILHPYLEYAFDEVATYNKVTKEWTLKEEAEPVVGEKDE